MKTALFLALLGAVTSAFAARPCEKNASKIARQILRIQEQRDNIQVRLLRAEVLPSQDEMTTATYDFQALHVSRGRRIDLPLTFSRLTMVQDDDKCVLVGYSLPEGN